MAVNDTKHLMWALLVSILTSLMIMAVGLTWAYKITRDSERKFCSLISALDNPSPPTTERGRRVAEEVRALGKSIDCSSTR